MDKKLLLIGIVGLLIITSLVIIGGNKEGQNPPNSAEGAPEGSLHNLPLPKAVAAVKSSAAKDAGIPEDQVLILTALEKEWSDSCLGLGGIAESCAQVITPGWEVVIQIKGQEVTYRSDAEGLSIRQAK